MLVNQSPWSPLSTLGVQACFFRHGFVGCQEVQQKKLQHQRVQRQISQEVRMVEEGYSPQCLGESLPCLKKTK